MHRLRGQNLEAEQQTPLVDIRRSSTQLEVPPPLPVMDEPAVYALHPDVMQVNTRKSYLRDRMRAALIYISEYMETKCMMTEGRYNNEELLVRLIAVFGCVDQVRDHIDRVLQQDDAHHRKRDMRFLILPTHFPRPKSMGQGDIAVWTNWICEETDEIMKQLEEEMWEDSLTQPCVIIVNLQNILRIHLKDRYHASCWDLRHCQSVLEVYSSGVPTETRE